MKKVIAIFDIGKTNKKLLLFDEHFQVVFQQEQKFPVTADDDGFECDDIDLITSWIKNELKTLAHSTKFELTAVNFSTYGASLMFLDENGNRLTPVYNYLKEAPSSISESLFENYGGKEEFCRKTASPALGLLLNSGIQIAWLKQEKPEVYQQATSILHFPQYLSYALTGKVVSEPTSIGCHTFMWNFDKMSYHQWLADYGIHLPDPITNDLVSTIEIEGKEVQVGTGIHDSSSSLAPYLKGTSEQFILVSTGTWCINMNPFNSEPLTAEQLEQDCLCFLSPDKQQVKSSRLFMGHFHEVWAEKLAKHFNVKTDSFRDVKYDNGSIKSIQNQFGNSSVFFPNGKESFEDGIKTVDLSQFSDYNEAYSKLTIDLTSLCIESIQLIIPQADETTTLYISGGFARNDIFINLLSDQFSNKKVITSEIDNASALGAALVIAKSVGFDNSLEML
ncbi:FGGY-family carbohydrate kinase [Sunxiuqinia indica]|uniref:FGGY-family carbohydrate kinase n=1 Tax=Sunxiuqinia indica TaxID=2692584 RepID=UPI00135B508C|nr:FGGY family carbohydrate kinase [Sunxiuqinia indica]